MKLAVALAFPILTALAVLPSAKRSTARPIARIHVDPTQPHVTHLLVYASGNVTIGVNTDTLRALHDTLHLTTPTNVTVDLGDGDLHIVGTDDQDVQLRATLQDAPAARLEAVGRHLVLDRGGTGAGSPR